MIERALSLDHPILLAWYCTAANSPKLKVLRNFVWIVWLAVCAALFARPFGWHIEIFGIAGPVYARLILLAIPALAAGAWLYHYVRPRGMIPYEPAIVPAIPAAICLLYAPRAFLASGAIALSAHATGAIVTVPMRLQTGLAMRILTGLGIFMCLLFPIGLINAYTWPVFGVLLLTPMALGYAHTRTLYSDIRNLCGTWGSDEGLRGALVSVAVLFGAVFAALCAISAVTPAMNGDALMLHLPQVHSFSAAHGLTTPATLPSSFFPQGVEMLMTMAYILGGEQGPQLIPPIFFVISVLLLLGIARRCGATREGTVVAVAIAASIPFLHWSGSVVKNDIALAAFELAALDCVLRWRIHGRFIWICLSAWFMAMAFMVKHVALFGVIAMAMLWVDAIWRQPRRVRAAVAVALVLLGFSSWFLLRTWIATGNPVYPETLSRTVTSIPEGKWSTGLVSRYLLTIPISHFNGKQTFESPTQNPMGMALIVLAPLCFVRPRPRQNEWWICLLFAVAYLLYWRHAVQVLRYAIPAIAVLALFVGERLSVARVPLRAPVLAATMIFSLLVTVVIEMYPAQVPLFAGRITKAEFLKASLPPFGAVEYIARNASSDDWILSVGAWCPAYSRNPDRFQLIYRYSRLYTPADLAGSFRENPRFRWVILPTAPNRAELETALALLKASEPVYSDASFVVYRVSLHSEDAVH